MSPFRSFEAVFGVFHQVSAVATDRFLPSRLVESTQKHLSKLSENKFKQFLRNWLQILCGFELFSGRFRLVWMMWSASAFR